MNLLSVHLSRYSFRSFRILSSFFPHLRKRRDSRYLTYGAFLRQLFMVEFSYESDTSLLCFNIEGEIEEMIQKKKKGSRALALAMSLMLILSACPYGAVTVYAASSFSDIKGHWSEFYIKKVNDANVISGYPDGRFRPDKAVTRAEFVSMVNKTFSLNKLDSVENVSLNDVPYTSWHYNDVSLAIRAGYAGGYSDNTFRPNSPITRQEASVMLARLIPEGKKKGNLKSFKDSKTIASWASDAMLKLNGKGYIGAYSDSKIHPEDPLTRSQTAKILSDILDNEDIVTRRTVVDDDKTTLSGKLYVGDVLIDEDLEEGSVTIDNCIILGDLEIEGGGTVTLNNTRVVKALVDPDDVTTKLVTKGTTVISKIEATDSCYIQTSGKDGLSTPEIILSKAADVTLKGNFPKVIIDGTKAVLTLESGKITDLTVTRDGDYSDIILSGKAQIETATVNAESYFHGTGTIALMLVDADDVTYETKPDKMTVGLKVDRPETEGNEKITVTFRPKTKAEDVDVDTSVTITFSTAMKLAGGKEITDSNISSFVTFTKNSKSGDAVAFKGTINSAKKIITLTPSAELSEGTRYYVVLADEAIQNGSGRKNDGTSIYFTTEGEATTTQSAITPVLSGLALTPAETTITATFTPNTSGTVYAIASTSSAVQTTAQLAASGSKVSASANTAGTITFTGLTSNTKYYISAMLRNSVGTDSAIVTSNTTTTMPEALLSGLTLTQSGVSGGANLLTNFSAATKSYDVTVPYGTTAVDVAATTDTASNTNAAFTINGTAGASQTGIAVTAGSVTKITVRITADNKKAVDYVINVSVAASGS